MRRATVVRGAYLIEEVIQDKVAFKNIQEK